MACPLFFSGDTVADKLTVRVGPRGCAVLRLAAAKDR
jgi:hypothetical protein